MRNVDRRFHTEAIRIASRRLAGLTKIGDIVVEYDGSVSQYRGATPVRSLVSINSMFAVFHREAYRELRVKAGMAPAQATKEWFLTY